ncbi:MAG: AAA family ATPase [bacterium]
MDQSKAYEVVEELENTIGTVLLGKPQPIRLLLTAFLADGHVLIEDVPGLGKTMLVRSLARAIDGSYRRIQFTPDLLPGDVTGTHIFNEETREFTFDRGPVFTEILLADEINRATPRTQSALLESMEERQITVDGETFPLPDCFFVAATQNPVEQQGTFPLPEAQLDRFLLKFSIGYPGENIEREVASIDRKSHPIDSVEAVCTPGDIVTIQAMVRNVDVEDSVLDYITQLARQTREHEGVDIGASPRGTMALRRACQSYAFMEGREYVTPDDVQTLLGPTLRHRIILDPREKMTGTSVDDVVEEIRSDISVPVEYEPSGE